MRFIAIVLALCFVTCLQGQTLDGFYSYTKTGTITNTSADTITLPVLMQSPWSFNWTMQAATATGTQNLTLLLQESASTKGTDWLTIGTLTTSGTANTVNTLAGPTIYGFRQRAIVVGAGTQSTPYTIYFVAKKVFK